MLFDNNFFPLFACVCLVHAYVRAYAIPRRSGEKNPKWSSGVYCARLLPDVKTRPNVYELPTCQSVVRRRRCDRHLVGTVVAVFFIFFFFILIFTRSDVPSLFWIPRACVSSYTTESTKKIRLDYARRRCCLISDRTTLRYVSATTFRRFDNAIIRATRDHQTIRTDIGPFQSCHNPTRYRTHNGPGRNNPGAEFRPPTNDKHRSPNSTKIRNARTIFQSDIAA